MASSYEQLEKYQVLIEVDEHRSAVGVVTRIEAFLNCLRHSDCGVNGGSNGEQDKRSAAERGIGIQVTWTFR